MLACTHRTHRKHRTHRMHHASTPATSTNTELPITMLGLGTPPSRAPTAPRPSSVVTETTSSVVTETSPSIQKTVTCDHSGSAPPPSSNVLAEVESEGPERQVAQAGPPPPATASEGQTGSQIPVRHVEFSPASVTFAEPSRPEGSRRQRRRQRLYTYLNTAGLPRQSSSRSPAGFHPEVAGAGILPPAVRPPPASTVTSDSAPRAIAPLVPDGASAAFSAAATF